MFKFNYSASPIQSVVLQRRTQNFTAVEGCRNRVSNGPSRSSKFVDFGTKLLPIESAYATSYWSSIVTLVLSCPVSEILQVSRDEEERPQYPPQSTRILEVFPLD